MSLGVVIICFWALVVQVSLIAVCSSQVDMDVFGVIISPRVQVLAGAWAFVGIPVVVCAGVGNVYRIELTLRVFFWYLLVSFFLGVSIPVYLLATGTICTTLVVEEVQKMGSVFVCSFTDTVIFTTSLFLGLIHMYLTYMVWSAAEEIAEAPFPELLKYSDALKGMVQGTPGPGPYPIGGNRAIPVGGSMQSKSVLPPPNTGYGTAMLGTHSSLRMRGQGPDEVPQNFVLQPNTAAYADLNAESKYPSVTYDVPRSSVSEFGPNPFDSEERSRSMMTSYPEVTTNRSINQNPWSTQTIAEPPSERA